ncbi:MAG: undecaprenyl-diphosphatase UppP [Patescibacteria group bacterium]
MELWSAALLGLVQGITEFLPISSTGHLILARDIFGISTENGLAYDAVLQLATVLAIIVYFYQDIIKLLQSIIDTRMVHERRLVVGIIIGTVPALIAGYFLESYMEALFRDSRLVAGTLIVGAALFVIAEYGARTLNSLQTISYARLFIIGCFQALALVPGMSRSGMSIVGGMFVGLSRADAARYSFLLAVPILVGTGLKKMFDLESSGALTTLAEPLMIGSVVAFVSGLLAIHVLLGFVRAYPLTVFAVYRVLLAVAILFFIV